jgi:hypothetical protein
MRRKQAGYLSATRHPWACLLFLFPLLIAYEGGLLWVGGNQPEALRNGADTWLHWGLQAFGLSELYWAPVLIALVFVAWSWHRWEDRPDDVFGTAVGMAIESVVFGFGLVGVSRALGPVLDFFGVPLSYPVIVNPLAVQLIIFVGAGIYEEVIFRLMLFAGGAWLLGLAEVPRPLALLAAGLGSALLFSAAHHAGPCGEPFDAYVFLFRTLAGLYFTLLYQTRGFGIAVGAHAGYDILVGTLIA